MLGFVLVLMYNTWWDRALDTVKEGRSFLWLPRKQGTAGFVQATQRRKGLKKGWEGKRKGWGVVVKKKAERKAHKGGKRKGTK